MAKGFKQSFKDLSRKSHININKQKCEFKKRKLEFFGYVFGESRMSADPKKVQIIKNTPAPKNV